MTSAMLKPLWQTVTATPDLLGESPFWHPLEKKLYWVDIPGKKVLRTQPVADAREATIVDVWHLPQEPGCIAPAKRGGFVLALRDGIYRAQAWGAELQKIATINYDTTKIRFNDGFQ